MPEYQVREYSNDRYDSGVRVKSAYRLYMPIYQKVMSVLFSIVFCVQLLNVIDKSYWNVEKGVAINV